MKISKLAAFAALCLGTVFAASGRTIKVSDIGYDPEDSTRFLQQALDSGAEKVVLDRQAGPWVTLPLKMRSNTELVFEPGVELLAKRGEYKGLRDYLLELPHCTNVTIRGGAGSTMRMWKKDYQGPDYEHGEWRYALRIFLCENVLVEGLTIVESGGDGIGISGRNIVVRNCVCDRNHRQGISVFTAENLLIENCVLSNTSGTAPAAGIDFEPDHSHERLVNVVMRNCLVENNDGNGYEVYLDKLTDKSMPVSITFEKCRAVGNRESVRIGGGDGNRSEHGFVKGFVKFADCAFESARSNGIALLAVPDAAFDVSFSGCVVSNAAPGDVKKSDVRVSSTRIAQGPCDGIDFGDMKIYQPVKRDWFSMGLQSVGLPPRRISGNVTVISPDGLYSRTVLDAEWVAKNMPTIEINPRLLDSATLPDVASVKVHDAAPGRSVALQPVALLMNANYLFFVEKPGRVAFTGRQINVVKGRPYGTRPLRICRLGPDGKVVKTWKIPIPGAASEEFGFTAPAAGFYRLTAVRDGTRFLLEKSAVPVAIDVMGGEQIMAARGGCPFSLWLDVPAGKEFAAALVGDDYYKFKVAVVDGSGKTVAANSQVENIFVVNGRADALSGMWRFDFSGAAEPHYDWVRLSCFGVPGLFFLTPDKVFSVSAAN